MNVFLSGFAFCVGVLIGLTGVGGGSITTPLLILLFGVTPVAAVSSDLAASLVIKPFGAAIHAARQRVDRSLLLWMSVGSVPAAFSGAFLLALIPDAGRADALVKALVGITLALTAVTFLARVVRRPRPEASDENIRIAPLVVIALGAFAGLLVGLTSIGSGAVIAAGLLLIYPRLPIGRVVGTDVAHAIPMVAAATLGHLLFGQVHIALALALIVGGVPGILLGAVLAGRVSSAGLRVTLGVLLVGIASTLLGAKPLVTVVVTVVAGLIVFALLRARRPATDTEPALPIVAGRPGPTIRPRGAPMMPEDHTLARFLANAAGEILLDLRLKVADLPERERGRAGDELSHRRLVQLLAEKRPGDVVLSEEGSDPARRIGVDRLWIIDPLDGTREFGEHERDDWAVHIALWESGQLAAGAVALPARDTTFATDAPPAIPPRPPHAGDRIRVAVSRTRPPALLDRLADDLDLELVPMGSAGVKTMAVLTGEVDAYLHGGGQYEWDSAAPVAVAAAAGAHTSRLDGSALRYNQPNPLLPDLLVCRPELATHLLDALKPLI
jgi:3'(2'), 5'-bisphosphate nucleotidase